MGDKLKEKDVAFLALIKDVHTKSLVCGTKSMRLILEIDNPSDELLDKINRLHRADRDVAVGLAKYIK